MDIMRLLNGLHAGYGDLKIIHLVHDAPAKYLRPLTFLQLAHDVLKAANENSWGKPKEENNGESTDNRV